MKRLMLPFLWAGLLTLVLVLVAQPSSALTPTTRQSAYPGPQLTQQPAQSFPPDSVTPYPQPTPLPTQVPSAAAQAALNYLAQRKNIPPSSLIIANDHSVDYPNLGRRFQAVKVLDIRPNGKFYRLFVDIDSGQVVEDVAAIGSADDSARVEKYGKLQKTLYDRLQTINDADVVTVTIWLVAAPGHALSELQAQAFATLAAKYPEAQAVVQAGGKPMDVADPMLAQRIYQEYLDLIDADVAQRIQPIVTVLEAQGISPRTSKGLPAVTAILSKATILLIAQRDDVGRIFLAEGKYFQLLDTAIPTDRVPAVWSRGYDGTGTKIAILEDDNVDFTFSTLNCPNSSNCFQHPGAVRAAVGGVETHATLVASAAASNHPTYHGVAPGATVLSAGITGSVSPQDVIDALVWAFSNGADVVNFSMGGCRDPNQDILEQSFDYYAKLNFRMIVAAAGNLDCGTAVLSPATGWNVLAVGGIDDKNDANWSDDALYINSSWANPASASGDHEKPEVVAPAANITGVGKLGVFATLSGTSFAAPQVAGLDALLIQRNSLLRNWPEAGRAIIMASAVHNVDGPGNIPTDQDLKDGAGAIDAALADTIAAHGTTDFYNTTPCSGPCWWGLTITANNFPEGTYLIRNFKASLGERIRVAIAWWSHADCASASACYYDRLDTDLDLALSRRMEAPSAAGIRQVLTTTMSWLSSLRPKRDNTVSAC